jgi:hypothetical protein
MTKLELVAFKTSRIQGRLERIRLGLSVGAEPFASRVTDEGWGTPASLGDTFTFLHQHGVIAPETAAAMRLGTKLRNLIAHAYGDVDPRKLFSAASTGLVQIERFLAETGAWVAARTGTKSPR